MWILYSLLLVGVCHMAYSSSEEEVDLTTLNSEQLADHLINKLQEHFGATWENKIPELLDQLKKLAAKKEQGLKLDSLEEKDSEGLPIGNPEMMLKHHWKKILHKVGHVAGKVITGAAANVAGKAIAGAIAG